MMTEKRKCLQVLALLGLLSACLAYFAVVGTQGVQASSCNCTLAEDDAFTYCLDHWNSSIAQFYCPAPGNPNWYLWSCEGDPNQILHGALCP
jgi:hypothetical protein